MHILLPRLFNFVFYDPGLVTCPIGAGIHVPYVIHHSCKSYVMRLEFAQAVSANVSFVLANFEVVYSLWSDLFVDLYSVRLFSQNCQLAVKTLKRPFFCLNVANAFNLSFVSFMFVRVFPRSLSYITKTSFLNSSLRFFSLQPSLLHCLAHFTAHHFKVAVSSYQTFCGCCLRWYPKWCNHLLSDKRSSFRQCLW